jgi:membrane protease YdiL (CAAX protease family)
VSSWFFNVADFANQYILPIQILQDAQESIVSQLVNPEHNDILASIVGYVAPCVTAPWWEELLYRGFCLPAFSQLMGYKWAVFWQGIVFSAHHMSWTGALPLAVLGWTWAVVYTKSRNLSIVVLIHMMWNSRVFLGSWLGL